MNNEGFVTMREIGITFGVSAQVIGRWLVKSGLQIAANRPSQRAFDGGLCQRDYGYAYLWHEQKTVEALRQARHLTVFDAIAQPE